MIPNVQQAAPANGTRFYSRLLAAALLLFLALTAGVYTGTVMSYRSGDSLAGALHNSSFLDVGDRFPDYNFWDLQTLTLVSLPALVSDQPAVLVLMSPSCPVCETLKRTWNAKVIRRLDPHIRVFQIYDESEWHSAGRAHAERAPLPGSRIVLADRQAQSPTDGLNPLPSIVGVDRSGRIRFVSTGFSRLVTADYMNKALR